MVVNENTKVWNLLGCLTLVLNLWINSRGSSFDFLFDEVWADFLAPVNQWVLPWSYDEYSRPQGISWGRISYSYPITIRYKLFYWSCRFCPGSRADRMFLLLSLFSWIRRNINTANLWFPESNIQILWELVNRNFQKERVKLPARRACLPGEEISFILCPSTPPIRRGLQGTFRPKKWAVCYILRSVRISLYLGYWFLIEREKNGWHNSGILNLQQSIILPGWRFIFEPFWCRLPSNPPMRFGDFMHDHFHGMLRNTQVCKDLGYTLDYSLGIFLSKTFPYVHVNNRHIFTS